jgi:hypothetical protein
VEGGDMKYAISTDYYAGTVGYVDLPVDRNWEDVAEWSIKWDTLYVWFKSRTSLGETADLEVKLNSDTLNIIDWKRPREAHIYNCDDNLDIDWNEEIDAN